MSYTATIGDKDFYLSHERDGKYIRVAGADIKKLNFTEACKELAKRLEKENIKIKESDYNKLFNSLCSEIYIKL